MEIRFDRRLREEGLRQAFLVSKSLGFRLLRQVVHQAPGALVLHPDDRADGRSVLLEMNQFCDDAGLRFQVVANRNEAEAALKSYQPDIALVCGWYWLLADAVRAIASHGFFGSHNSLLPKYRGGAPLVWAIIHGEEEVGSTLFRLDDGIDDGPIAHQVRIQLKRTATIHDALQRVEACWEAVFADIWRAICAGTLALREQIGEPSVFPNRKPPHGVIDWTMPAAKVHDFIRAQCFPYPGAFCGGTIFDHSCEKGPKGIPRLCGDGEIIYVTERRQA